MNNERSDEKANEVTPINSNQERKSTEETPESRRFKEKFKSPEWLLAQLALDFFREGQYEKGVRFWGAACKIKNMKISDQEEHIWEELENIIKSFRETLVQTNTEQQAEQAVVVKKQVEAHRQMTSQERINQRGQEVKQRIQQADIDEFLTCVYRGNLEKVKACLERYPELCRAQGDIKDLSEREFKQITGFQYAYWALDVEMWELILKYLPDAEARDQVLALATERTDIVEVHGEHYCFDDYLSALTRYLANYDQWRKSYDRDKEDAMVTCLAVDVGGAEGRFPSWMIMLMSEEGIDVAWAKKDLLLEFTRDEKYLEGWFVQEKTHRLGAMPSLNKLWGDPSCGFSWFRGSKAKRSFDGWPEDRVKHDLEFCATFQAARVQAVKNLRHRLCNVVLSTSSHVNQTNKELNSLIEKRKFQDIRSFDQDYSIETLTYLIHMPQSPCLKYVFKSGVKEQFIKQLDALRILANAINCPAVFITPAPAEMDSSHFICGVFHDNALLLINPLGEKLTKDTIEILKRITKKNREDCIVESLFLSTDILQKDPDGQFSCGPICVDVVNELINRPDVIQSQFAEWKRLPQEKSKEVNGLRYQPISVRSVCVSDQIEGINDENVIEVIEKIRLDHFDGLYSLELSIQEGNKDISFDTLMNSPEQVLIFKLAFERLNLNDCLEHEEFKKLQARLVRYRSAENKLKPVDVPKEGVVAESKTKSEVYQQENPQEENDKSLSEMYVGHLEAVEKYLDYDDVRLIDRYEVLLKSAAGDKWHSGINQQNLREESEILARLEEMAKKDNAIPRLLWDLIFSTREVAGLEIAAANAMTLLNRIGTNFSGMDLSEVQIPGADLRGGNFHETNFTGANLEGVWFHGAWTSGAKVCLANLKGVVWGESAPMVHPVRVNAIVHYLSNLADDNEPMGYWLSGCADGKVYLWSVHRQEIVATFERHTGGINPFDPPVLCVAVHHRTRQMASGCADSSILVWDIPRRQCLRTLQGHSEKVNSVAYHPNGDQLASGSEDTTVRLWSLETGECLRVLVGHFDRVSSVAYHPEGKGLASGGREEVRLWSLETGECLRVLESQDDMMVSSVVYHPDGNELAAGSENGTVRLWSLETGECLRVLEGHLGEVDSVAYHPERKELASGGSGEVRLWSLETGKCLRVFICQSLYTPIAFHPGGKELASGSKGDVYVWQLEKGGCFMTLGHEEGKNEGKNPFRIAYHPDGKALVSWRMDDGINALNRLSLKTGMYLGLQILINGSSNHRIISVAYHPKENEFALGSADKTVQLWSLENEWCRKVLEGHRGIVNSVAYHPEGKELASGSNDMTVRVWPLKYGWERVLKGHTGIVNCVAYHPNGNQLASGSEDTTVRLWPVVGSRCERVLKGHGKSVNSIAYHPGGKELASGSADKTVHLWSLEKEDCVRVLKGHSDSVTSVAYAPGGALLASASEDKTVRIWNITTEACLRCMRFSQRVVTGIFHPTSPYITVGYDNNIAHFQYDAAKAIESVSSSIPFKLLWRTGSGANFYGVDVSGSINCSPATERLLSFHQSVGKLAPPRKCYQPLHAFFQPVSTKGSSTQRPAFVDTDKQLALYRDRWVVSVARQIRGSAESFFSCVFPVCECPQHTFLIIEGIMQQGPFIIRAELIRSNTREPIITLNPLNDDGLGFLKSGIQNLEVQQWDIPADVGRKLIRNIREDQRKTSANSQADGEDLILDQTNINCAGWAIKQLTQLGNLHIEIEDRWIPILRRMPKDIPLKEANSSLNDFGLNSNN